MPPLCWLLKLSGVILFTYPILVRAITQASSGIRSSIERSYSSYPIEVLLSSPYLSAIRDISVFITVRSLFLSASIALYSSIFFCKSASSASILLLSKPVRALRRISTIACDCASVRLNSFIRLSLAACTVEDPLMIDITLSILSRAIINPSNMCALSSALLRSYLVLLVTTSS